MFHDLASYEYQSYIPNWELSHWKVLTSPNYVFPYNWNTPLDIYSQKVW